MINDNLSGWDGKTTFSELTATLPANASAIGIARNGSTTAQYLVYAPSTGLGGIVNFANTMRSTTNGSNILGVPVVGPALNIAALPLFETIGLPENRFANAIAGSAFRPKPRTFTTAPDAVGFEQNYKIYSAFLNQQLGRHFFFELAGNYSWDKRTREYPAVRGLSETYIDLQRNLPTERPTRNFSNPITSRLGPAPMRARPTTMCAPPSPECLTTRVGVISRSTSTAARAGSSRRAGSTT